MVEIKDGTDDFGIVLKSIVIKNARFFENVTIPLEKQGIVLILGDNGSGKSTIWDILESIFYGSTPQGHKKDELTLDKKDAFYQVNFRKDKKDISVATRRVNKKWSYEIVKDGQTITDHSYYDAIKAANALIGLTKDEFEGSVHLTQHAQHLLISGKLSQRREYISNFFNIDNRYDAVYNAAKIELEAIQQKINNLSAFTHSKSLLEQQIDTATIQDVAQLEKDIANLKYNNENLQQTLKTLNCSIELWELYNKHYVNASYAENSYEQLQTVNKSYILLQDKKKNFLTIQQRNAQTKKVNDTIDILEAEKAEIETNCPDVLKQIDWPTPPKQEMESLKNLKNQNQAVINLRNELEKLPLLKALPIEQIEQQLVQLQIEYQTHIKHKQTKEKGICTECGSQFQVMDIQNELNQINEIKTTLDGLQQDYKFIKDRNQKAIRREQILQSLQNIPEWTDQKENLLKYLTSYIFNTDRYTEINKSLSILERSELIVLDNIESIELELNTLQLEKTKLMECVEAQKLIPNKPDTSQEELITQKWDTHNELNNTNNQISTLERSIGEIKNLNDMTNRNIEQLKQINIKLASMDTLKKDEYFWSTMVLAYGPKGLRVQQLQKMLDLVIKRLPIYANILFDEHIAFKYKCDANNVKIIACRTTKKDGELIKFEHDISSFSGGEKARMSTDFILTLAECVPHNKRSNILVLDEVDSALDELGKFKFINELLPMLKQKYESIFIVSHSPQIQQAAVYDKVWKISKKNGKSVIEF